MANDRSEGRFVHRRRAGNCHHTYGVEVSGMGYAIKLNGRVMKAGAAEILSEDVDRLAALRLFAISDIENLAGMAEE